MVLKGFGVFFIVNFIVTKVSSHFTCSSFDETESEESR